MRFVKFCLENSRPINVLRIAFAILGIIFLFSIPREQYPNITLYYVHVLVPYPGASAIEIEKEITQKVEAKVKQLNNITGVNSVISDGLSFTRVAYKQSLSKKQFTSNYLELQASISNMEIPEGAHAPIVDNFTYDDFLPVINVVIYTNENTEDVLVPLINTANRVKNNLELNKDVSSVKSKGLFSGKIRIRLDHEALTDNNISIFEITEAIEKNNISIPAGQLSTEQRILNIRTSSQTQDLVALENTIVRATPAGPIFLKDVATIENFYDTSHVSIRYNGNTAVTLQVYKNENVDSISLIKKIDDEVEKLNTLIPEDMVIATFGNTTINVQNSISVLTSNALIGFLLLCFSLLLFLGWKPALISALEIPFTFATSLFVLKILGITLNTSTLFALVLVLGMIVDHGIVILENMIRLRHFKGFSRFDSIAHGISEVGLPVITSSLTTIGTFFPLIFMPGLIGSFLLPVPITITVTLIVSTISALIIVPIHYMEFPGNERTHELKIFDWGRAGLGWLLRIVLRFKLLTCILSLLISFGAIAVLFYLPVSLYDTEDQPFFFVDIELPQGSTMETSNTLMNALEDEVIPLIEDDTIKSVMSVIGDTSIDPVEGIRFDKPQNAQLQIEVYADQIEPEQLNAIIEKVEERINAAIVNIRFTYKIRKQRTGPPTSSAVGVKIAGDNLDHLRAVEGEILAELYTYNELYNIRSDFKMDKLEYLVRVDEEQASLQGLTVDVIGATVRQWLSNNAVISLFINNDRKDVIVQIDNISDVDKESLNYITFPDSRTGQLVYFNDVAELITTTEINSIYREDGKRLIKITADATSRDRIRQINSRILSQYDNELALEYPDTIVQIGGEFDEFSDLLNDILMLFIIGMLVVYVILVAEFKSYFQPLLIMLTILFTTIGVSFFLLVTKTELSIVVLYSFVALVGVVVNGSIILVSTANKFYLNNELTHLEAIKKATIQRFKPIFLTNFTTILGILPTALGLSGSSPVWRPMASTIVVGLIFSTFTTLLIIPAFYALLPQSKHKRLVI